MVDFAGMNSYIACVAAPCFSLAAEKTTTKKENQFKIIYLSRFVKALAQVRPLGYYLT
ncbi:MAG: hypothetical protein Tsb002_04640 [Wenzhouxiangellaceae bacterium]